MEFQYVLTLTVLRKFLLFLLFIDWLLGYLSAKWP